MNKPNPQSGISVVELLITLFVAFLFIMMGYQLFDVLIKNGGDARGQAKASNIAYKYLRSYSLTATAGTCPNPLSSPPTNQSIAGEMPNAFLTITASCPVAQTPSLRLVTVMVAYGNNPQRKVSHAIYANK